MISRTGKIDASPRAEQFARNSNRRIEDGRPAKTLVRWLNGHKEVKAVLAEDFAGREISEQNLCDWKRGGFHVGCASEVREQVRLMAEQAEDLATEDARQSIADNLAGVLVAELAVATKTLLAETTDTRQRWLYLRQAIKQLQQLRRSSQLALRVRMELENWEIECEERELAKRKAAVSAAEKQAMDPLREIFQRTAYSKIFGGGEAGEQAADYIMETKRKVREAEDAAAPSEPGEIKANQGKSRKE